MKAIEYFRNLCKESVRVSDSGNIPWFRNPNGSTPNTSVDSTGLLNGSQPSDYHTSVGSASFLLRYQDSNSVYSKPSDFRSFGDSDGSSMKQSAVDAGVSLSTASNA